MRFSWTISRYLIGAVLPYLIFSWLLLSVILFVQQASRFSDIFFSVNLPSNLIWQLTLALVPNVIAFTCPMAALVGVIIGLSKMQGDSELVAIRAAGVGNLQITGPIAFLGVVLSAFGFIVNLYGVPLAAQIVRRVALQTAIYKLESPIEPGVFNTEIAGYTIYVKDGDLTDGRWKNIFIHQADEKAGIVRLITSSSGRIDYTREDSELVLEDAVASTFTQTSKGEKFVSEKVGEIRYTVKTRRGELIERLSSAELTPEELGLGQLSEYAGQKDGRERTEAQILWYRRIVLSITPLIFCLLGTAMVLRFSRRGRGFGIFVALISLIAYYLLAFFGEQLSRTGKIDVLSGSLIPVAASFAAILWFHAVGRLSLLGSAVGSLKDRLPRLRIARPKLAPANLFVDLTTGLRDFDLVINLAKYYLLTLAFLASVFIIFTAFELWKFAGTMENGVALLTAYLLYLLPFIYIQLSPSSAMIAVLATYVIKSRQNEIVTWISAGLSIYRLLLPSLFAMVALGLVNFGVQELLLPEANRIQDNLRLQIRSRGVAAKEPARYWVATDKRIFVFDPTNGVKAEEVGLHEDASDNDKRLASDTTVRNLTIFDLSDKGAALQAVYRIPAAYWSSGRISFSSGEKKEITGGSIRYERITDGQLLEPLNPFAQIRSKPSHLNIAETRAMVEASESDVEKRSFALALEKKYATLVLPFVITLLTAPFALSLSRKGKVMTVGYAIALWLLFMGLTGVFDQLGLNGYIAPAFAVWGPLTIFSMTGIYLLSNIKT